MPPSVRCLLKIRNALGPNNKFVAPERLRSGALRNSANLHAGRA